VSKSVDDKKTMLKPFYLANQV